jgi:cob(I)alamin adenosyltransferase
MSIVTKTGDSGETSLMYGRRVSKTDARVEAYGCVDELNAALGVVRALVKDEFVSGQVHKAQEELIIVMGELATAPQDLERYCADGFSITSDAMVSRVTDVIADLEKDESLYPKDWVLPGNTPESAALDVARVTCRRAERRVVALEKPNAEIIRYLNRLSDLCWVLGRFVEKKAAGH